MKLSGVLSAAAFQAFQGGFEGRCYTGLQNRYTRYLRPAHVRLLRGAGYIDNQLKAKPRKDIEGVVSHFVNVRHADGMTSERIYSLVVIFERLDTVGIWTVPSEVFMSDTTTDADGEDGDGEDEPALRNCPTDMCIRAGLEKSCDTLVNMVPEDEECPDPKSGCPGTECAGGSGDGDDEPTDPSMDVGQVLGL